MRILWLLIVFNLILALHAMGQGKRFTEEHKALQLREMQDGVLLVPLFKAVSDGGILTTTQSNQQTLKAEHNSQIIRAFETLYPFGETYYFYDENWLKILEGERQGIILNSDRKPVPTEKLEDKTFFLARFEPEQWHLRDEVEFKKKSVNELKTEGEAHRENLPQAVDEETALAIPLFRSFTTTENVHRQLLNDRLKTMNQTIIRELNACEVNYPVYFFYENKWVDIQSDESEKALFDCGFKNKVDHQDKNELTLFVPPFCPAPQTEQSSTAFEREMAIMNPNSNYYPALIIERLYGKAHPKSSRRSFLMNFRYAYRLNFSSGLQGSYQSAVEGIVDKIKLDMADFGLVPSASEEQ